MVLSFKGITVMMIVMVVSMAVASQAEIAVQKSDSRTLGVVYQIDQDEIQAAQLALQKNINHTVIDYARRVDQDHYQNLHMLRGLSRHLGIRAGEDGASQALRLKRRQELAVLTAIDGDPFAQLYVADTIKSHSEALNWIDAQSAQDNEVKEFLQETKAMMTGHFKAAQKIHDSQIHQNSDGGLDSQ